MTDSPVAERAYLHQSAAEPKEHLWFVLSEPDEPPLAVCLALTFSDPTGQALCAFRARETLTYPNGGRTPYITTSPCTVAIAYVVALTRAEATARYRHANCCGEIKGPILRQLREAICAGRGSILDAAARAEVARVCSAWFPPASTKED